MFSKAMKDASYWIFDSVDGDVRHGAEGPQRRSSRIFRGEIMVTGYPVWGVRGVLWGWCPCGVDSHLRPSVPPAGHLLLQDLLLVLEMPQLSMMPVDTTLARRQVSPIGSHVFRCRGCRLEDGSSSSYLSIVKLSFNAFARDSRKKLALRTRFFFAHPQNKRSVQFASQTIRNFLWRLSLSSTSSRRHRVMMEFPMETFRSQLNCRVNSSDPFIPLFSRFLYMYQYFPRAASGVYSPAD